jgi:hypothetical protein
MKTYVLQPSTRKNKKWMVLTPEGNTVHFGQEDASDYTLHKEAERKQRYIKRHGGSKTGKTSRKEDWTKKGLNTAGFWSRWLLWEKPSLKASIDNIEKRFGIKIERKGSATSKVSSPSKPTGYIRCRTMRIR